MGTGWSTFNYRHAVFAFLCAVPEKMRVTAYWLRMCAGSHRVIDQNERGHVLCRPLPHMLPLPDFQTVV